MLEKIIIALDVDTEEEAMFLVKELRSQAAAFKIGLQLYNTCGPGIVQKLSSAGVKVFLDLKFHDIPNTVAKATEAVVGLGAFMINLHALGGKKMMASAAVAARKRSAALGISAPLLLGVTILTSMSEQELHSDLGIIRPMEEQVVSLALLCREAGLDGVVASAGEIPGIRRACGQNFKIVTPGVRPAWSPKNDQARIVTPQKAIALGADFLVIGRPVTAAPEPAGALSRLLEDIEGGK